MEPQFGWLESYRLHLDTGTFTEPQNLDSAMYYLEFQPLSTLEMFGSNGWEVVFDGAVEFSGVKPERCWW